MTTIQSRLLPASLLILSMAAIPSNFALAGQPADNLPLNPSQLQYGADLEFHSKKACDAAYAAISASDVLTVLPDTEFGNTGFTQKVGCSDYGKYYGIRVFSPDLNGEHISKTISKSDCEKAKQAFEEHGKKAGFYNTEYALADEFRAPESAIISGEVRMSQARCESIGQNQAQLHLDLKLLKAVRKDDSTAQNRYISDSEVRKYHAPGADGIVDAHDPLTGDLYPNPATLGSAPY
jgi:hypothetical protein